MNKLSAVVIFAAIVVIVLILSGSEGLRLSISRRSFSTNQKNRCKIVQLIYECKGFLN
jgi:hypothetical protein